MELMPKDESMNIRYLLCNADEMEPGTYKDRLLMEQLSHLLVKALIPLRKATVATSPAWRIYRSG